MCNQSRIYSDQKVLGWSGVRTKGSTGHSLRITRNCQPSHVLFSLNLGIHICAVVHVFLRTCSMA